MNNPLSRLSPRERRLLMATTAVLAVAALLLLGRRAALAVRDFDEQIADRELEIVSLTEQNLQGDAVNEAYARVVKQHSSELTVEQIHDALRREIFRLAQVEFPATPTKPARTVQLVRIPALLEGQLTEGEGHREYQIRFQIPAAGLPSLLSFLERVEKSDQLLRIDKLEIGRAPEGALVAATLQITRTVLDDPEAVRYKQGSV